MSTVDNFCTGGRGSVGGCVCQDESSGQLCIENTSPTDTQCRRKSVAVLLFVQRSTDFLNLITSDMDDGDVEDLMVNDLIRISISVL